MELALQSFDGGKTKAAIEVSAENFARDFNESLVHQVVVAYQANARAGTRAQKNRSEVRGGGKKPWRQKGTGRARAGTNCSPIWRTGGVTFAAKPQDHSQKVNRKMYRAAMQAIVSELHRQERLVIVDELKLESPKTKALVAKLNEHSLDNALLVSEELDANLFLASRNIRHIQATDVSAVDPVSLISFEKVVFTAQAVKKLEEMLA